MCPIGISSLIWSKSFLSFFLLSVLLTYNWHIALYKFKVYSIMTYIYCVKLYTFISNWILLKYFSSHQIAPLISHLFSPCFSFSSPHSIQMPLPLILILIHTLKDVIPALIPSCLGKMVTASDLNSAFLFLLYNQSKGLPWRYSGKEAPC